MIKKTAVSFATLGCKVNQYDSGAMAESLGREGCSIVPVAAGADICIVNTCVVTESTESRSRQLIRRILREHPACRIIVTGCYAQKSAPELQALSERVCIIGNTEKKDIAAFVRRLAAESAPFTEISDIAGERRFTTPACAKLFDRTRAFLKIQDGCNSCCTYCIVPSVRGPSRSLPATEVKKRLVQLQAAGYREVVLTGIHLGAYGLDASPRTSLAGLLGPLEHDPQLCGMRLRLSSIEPTEFTADLLELMAGSRLICPHVHIPLQSGDAAVLKKMGRPYDPHFYRALLYRISAAVPGINIGIDVIAGFPGETEEGFENTENLLRELPAGYLHVFPYSRRSGTPAAAYPLQVPEHIKKARALRLRNLSEGKKLYFYSTHIGAVLPVLVENRRSRTTGLLQGMSRNYIPVRFEGPAGSAGTEVLVRAIDADASGAEGKIEQHAVCQNEKF